MLKQIEQLLVIQDRDKQIKFLQLEERNLPLERKSIEEKLAAAGAHVAALKQKAREVEVERKKLELEVDSKQQSIAKFRNQQFQTRKNEEFQALANEIKRFEVEISSLEDRELELMEQTDVLKNEIAAAEQEFAGTKKNIQQQVVDIDAKVGAVDRRIGELQTDRARLAAEVDPDLLDHYTRLFHSKGDAAIVPLQHEVCMGCHMKLTTQTAVRAKAGKEMVSCEQCGRILYFEP